MEGSNGESRPETLKLSQPVSIDAEVQTEDSGMPREGKSCRGRGRGQWKGGSRGGRGFKRRARGGTVDDFPFLHGGNSKDPLNLKSVKPVDEEENMKPVDIIIPKNIHDPLNLRNVNKNRARRKRRNSKLTEKDDIEGSSESSSKRRGSIASGINEKRQEDPIVSPVPLSVVRKFSGNSSRRLAQQKIEKKTRKMQENTEKPQPESGVVAGASNSEVVETSKIENEKNAREKEKKTEKREKNNQRYRYGNYARYYGSRLEKGSGIDPRMKVLKKEWFEKKSVLDIGCNVGYLTLSIAKEFQPRNIVGIDIDAHLVGVARKNIRHYCDKDVPIVGGFPASFAHRYGPLSAPPTSFSTKFPDNIWFRCENYVLERDELLDAVKEEYDVIMALSITKWIHLNWGDVGIKRFFKRVYRHLRPGGLFILEPQSFETYKKRAKLTKSINEMYKTIEFMPNAFQEYLITDIGFDSCKHIDPPKAHTKGFERPIQIYYKRVSPFSRTGCYDHDGIPKTYTPDSVSLRGLDPEGGLTEISEPIDHIQDKEIVNSKAISGNSPGRKVEAAVAGMLEPFVI
uniref:RNA methyltransferase n=1 Tax=Setaria digitata TaxID=48799 RepID=A0A915Q6R6_9BILA